MKRWGSSILASTAFLLSITTSAWAQQQATTTITPNTVTEATTSATPSSTSLTPATPVNPALPLPPVIAANAYLLLDVNSGQILAENNADMPVEPASITKLMTAYLVFDALRNHRLTLDQTLTVSARARHMEGSRMFVEQNAQVRVEDLIMGMIVQSGNDATVVLAEGVGGSVENFVSMMNQQARVLGMRNTTFMNPEGLPAQGHETTAHDLAILATRLMTDFPQEYRYYAIKEFTYPHPAENTKPITQPNRNRLLFIDPTVDGLKTGHTSSAGFCLVSSSAREFPNLSEKRRLLAIVLGAQSDAARTQESQKLLNWGFQAWNDVEIFEANQTIVTPRVWKGSVNEAKLGLGAPVVVTVPAGMAGNIKTNATYTTPLLAPITRGTEVGEIRITLDTPSGSVLLGTRQLIVLEDIEEAGFFGRLWDGFRLWIQ